jgi:uncharacterized damage-inducible protein DinB
LSSLVDALLPEYDHEMATTRRLLERVREGDFPWKPHEKSMTLGELSGHLTDIPMWCSSVLDMPSLDLDEVGDRLKAKSPGSGVALLEHFDRRVSTARARLVKSTDAELLAPWALKRGTQELFTLPRISAIRTFMMNHLIHHRGQLSVYLRLRDIAVPAIYGPTADEP